MLMGSFDLEDLAEHGHGKITCREVKSKVFQVVEPP